MPPKRNRWRLTEAQLDKRTALLEKSIAIQEEIARRRGITLSTEPIDVGPTGVGSIIEWDGVNYLVESFNDDGSITLSTATNSDLERDRNTPGWQPFH